MEALEGIGFLRGIREFEVGISWNDAVQKLNTSDAFFTKVGGFLPFLDLDLEVGLNSDNGGVTSLSAVSLLLRDGVSILKPVVHFFPGKPSPIGADQKS